MNILHYLSTFLNTIFNMAHTESDANDDAHDDIEIANVKRLYKAGENLNERCDQGYTLLHTAIHKNRSDIIRLLITLGADINATDTSNLTCLETAIKQNNHTIVEILCEADANVNVMNSMRFTSLHLAISLHSVSDLNLKYDAHKLIYAEKLAIIETLCKYKVNMNMNAMDLVGATALHLATNMRELAVIKILYKYGADLNKIDLKRETALCLAIENMDCDIVESLAKYGANLDKVVGIYMVPLHRAIRNGNVLIVKLLITYGANVNIEHDDSTPLHMAIRIYAGPNKRDYFEIIEQLILADARTNIKDDNNENALELATRRGYNEIVELITYGARAYSKSARKI